MTETRPDYILDPTNRKPEIEVTINVTRACGHRHTHRAVGRADSDDATPDMIVAMARSAAHDMTVVPHRCTYGHKPTDNPIEGQCDDCGLL